VEEGFVSFESLQKARQLHSTASPPSREALQASRAWRVVHACDSVRQVLPVVEAQASAGMKPYILTPQGECLGQSGFRSRPLESRLGACASPQSEEVADRAELERLLADFRARCPGEEVPRPPHWGGYRLTPDRFEFWQGRPGRLHDRLEYFRADGAWRLRRLAP